jgi:hypothetical protein
MRVVLSSSSKDIEADWPDRVGHDETTRHRDGQPRDESIRPAARPGTRRSRNPAAGRRTKTPIDIEI